MSRRAHYPDTPWRADSPGDALAAMLYKAARQAIADSHAEAAPIQPRLLNVDQAGAYLGRPASTIKSLVSSGRLRKASSDKRLLIAREDLDAFVEEERRLAAGETA